MKIHISGLVWSREMGVTPLSSVRKVLMIKHRQSTQFHGYGTFPELFRNVFLKPHLGGSQEVIPLYSVKCLALSTNTVFSVIRLHLIVLLLLLLLFFDKSLLVISDSFICLVSESELCLLSVSHCMRLTTIYLVCSRSFINVCSVASSRSFVLVGQCCSVLL